MNIILTIIIPVYNHERYILQALHSVENQNIEVPYEVIIGEDCSSDNSRTVLEKYQKGAPQNYQFIYRNDNWGMYCNITDLFYKARGKYIIVLEADDYWSYNNKINEQIKFLEANEQYSGYAHSVMVIDEKEQPIKSGYYAEKGKGKYTCDDYLQELLPGQTASFMYRNYFTQNRIFKYLEGNEKYPLDRFIAFVVASKGDIYCTSQKWSVYRYITKGGSSYSANRDATSAEFALSALKYHKAIYNYATTEICNKKCIGVSEKLYYKSFLRDWLTGENRNVSYLIVEINKAKYPFKTFFWIVLEALKFVKIKVFKVIEKAGKEEDEMYN